MSTIYLTSAEAKKFEALSAALKGSWTVEVEMLTYDDSPERRDIRFELMHITDPEILRFREVAGKAKNENDFIKAMKTLDLKKINDKDFTQMLFALGPNAMSLIIDDFLMTASSADDVEQAAAFAALRHGMLESLTQYSTVDA